MEYKIAYNREKDLEFFLYPRITIDDGHFHTTKRPACMPKKMGTLLLDFLNTNFEKIEYFTLFIYEYCFYTFYTLEHPEEKHSFYTTKFEFNFEDYISESHKLAKEHQDMFLYVQHLCFYYLNLPYNIDYLKVSPDDDDDYSDIINADRSNIDVNKMTLPLDDISLDFDLFSFMFTKTPLYSYNVPYAFCSYDIFSILSLELREFLSRKQHVIRKCQNCGKYFIPNNLKETKYCNEEDIITGKTCKQVGRDLVYKRSLQENPPLELYRKRYMSLASSVSHYGTDKAIERFERYKFEGAIMKQKYLNKEITANEFEQWINYSRENKK